MTASVLDFLANFTGGGARPNRYRVILTFPPLVPNTSAVAPKVAFTCRAASIPTSNLGVCNVPYMGRTIKVPGDKQFDDWTVRILIDNDFATRIAFESWHNALLNFDANVASEGMINPINGFATAQVQQLDRYDQPIQNYTIEAMWPTTVGDIELAYDANDQVEEQTVSFAVNGWRSDVTT